MIDIIQQRLQNARTQLEELRSSRVRQQESLRQLDLNEAGWLGYIEAMTQVESEIESQQESVSSENQQESPEE